MSTREWGRLLAMGLIGFFLAAPLAQAGDTDDGIADVNDDPVAASDNLGSKDTNVKYIVTEGISKAKVKQKKADDKKDDVKKVEAAKTEKTKVNVNNGKGKNNQNSVVVGAGSRVEKVYNIVIQK